MLKTISYNILILFVLANVLFWSIPTVGLISDMIKGKHGDGGWGFRSFVGWQHPQRPTVNGKTTGDQKIYFFGGSTMWGLGVSESETIPSAFAAATGLHSENYGNVGYTSHQSLVLLLQLLQAGHRPNLVVFYDGVNDVAFKCEHGLTPESHAREPEINSLLRGHDTPSSFTYYFRPVIRLAERVDREISKSIAKLLGGKSKSAPIRNYDCDTNRDKAQAIAENLVLDWQFAKLLVETFGGKFIAILQPVAFFSRTRLDHIEFPPNLEQQYQAVYPLVREKIARDGPFHDLVSALDVDEVIYTDYNHITPQGNRYVARRIAEIVAPANAAR